MSDISEVDVSFRIHSDRLDPTEVTAQLGLIPDMAYIKGELSPPGSVTGRSYPYRTGMWLVETPLPRTAELDAHLRALLDLLGSKVAMIHAFKAQGYTIDFYCGLFLESDNEGLALSAETLARVAALGAELDLDIYAVFDDEKLSVPQPGV